MTDLPQKCLDPMTPSWHSAYGNAPPLPPPDLCSWCTRDATASDLRVSKSCRSLVTTCTLFRIEPFGHSVVITWAQCKCYVQVGDLGVMSDSNKTEYICQQKYQGRKGGKNIQWMSSKIGSSWSTWWVWCVYCSMLTGLGIYHIRKVLTLWTNFLASWYQGKCGSGVAFEGFIITQSSIGF